mgnify:CR=1 FL=1
MRSPAKDLADLMAKSPLDLARAVAEGAPPSALSAATRGWLAGLRRFLAKAKPANATAGNTAAAQAALGQDDAPAKPWAREVGHRYVTVHTGGPDSPGHTVRMVPHPERPGEWTVHEADREQARALFGKKKRGRRRSGATLALRGRARTEE